MIQLHYQYPYSTVQYSTCSAGLRSLDVLSIVSHLSITAPTLSSDNGPSSMVASFICFSLLSTSDCIPYRDSRKSNNKSCASQSITTQQKHCVHVQQKASVIYDTCRCGSVITCTCTPLQ